MSWPYAQQLEDAVTAAAARHLPAEVLATKALLSAIADRSRRYTEAREGLADKRHEPRDLAARALFFTICDAPKLIAALAQASALGLQVLARPALRVLDVGAGCGAMTLGMLAFAASRGYAAPIEVELCDQDAGALAIAHTACTSLARALNLSLVVGTTRLDVARGGGALERLASANRFDLIMLGSVLNELPLATAQSLVESCMPRLEAHGAVVVIEPALKQTARTLHQLRDAWLSHGVASVMAPCTHARGCPMLQGPDDWCHQDTPIRWPSKTHELSRITGLRDSGLKYAHLVLTHPGAYPSPPDRYHLLATPRQTKGKVEVAVCGERGVVGLRRLQRHNSAANAPFAELRRGDIVAITGLGAEGDIDANTAISRQAMRALEASPAR